MGGMPHTLGSGVRALLTGLLVVLGGSVASTATAQEDDPRLAAALALGLGGDADITTGFPALDGSVDLDPTVGFGVRGEFPLHRYFVLGGSFELMTFELDGGGTDFEREEVFDFDGILRARYPVELSAESIWVEPYVALPVGFSMGVFPEGDGDQVWPGWNLGVLAGAYLLVPPHVGFFLELGWRHHQVYSDVEVLGTNRDRKIVTNQFALQLGAALLLP